MTMNPTPAQDQNKSNRRAPREDPQKKGVALRGDDIEGTRHIRSVAKLFRALSVLLLVLMGLQIINGLSSTVAISYGVLFAEAFRLLIFAAVLWGTGDLAVLFVKSHYDLRATRILLERQGRARSQVGGDARPGDTEGGGGEGDRRH